MMLKTMSVLNMWHRPAQPALPIAAAASVCSGCYRLSVQEITHGAIRQTL